jgi:class 3 adenylate cyclase
MLADSGEDSYYAAATEGEAQLLLGRRQAARRALERAAARHGGDYAALATTRRQLRILCTALGLDPDLLVVLAGPRVVHFCGHRISDEEGAGRFPRDAEARVAARVAEVVASHPAGFAYGSLASGADILWAEALLAGGAELHVVLPFARQEFLELSVLPSAGDWGERFDRCLAAATTVDYATNDAFLGDDVLFRYGTELAMGLALLRAQYLDSEARQLAVWDGRPADGAAGTAIDIATWRQGGRPATIVSPARGATVTEIDGDAAGTSMSAPVATSTVPFEHRPQRVVRSMLFADVQGFSRLADEQLPVFADRILGAFAAVVERHQDQVWHRNTWGDAVYVVLTDARSAAACALDLQDAIAALDLERDGLPAGLALRLGGHVGPVFPTHDPVLDEPAYMGSHVSRTARIEPVTPPGTVYVTEPFAAALVLDGSREFTSDYVGRMAAAKHYGVLRMYRLRRRPGGDVSG